MGDRASISFKNEDRESVALYSHWGGMAFVKKAKDYVRRLKKEVGTKEFNPLDRLDPETVMVDFIRYLTADVTRVSNDLYLGKDEDDGDNSDNGHHVIDCSKTTKRRK